MTAIKTPPGASTEWLSGSEFLDELRHVVGFLKHAKSADPLASVTEQIISQPALAQSRLLLRILVALVHQRGDFRRAEIAMLGTVSLAQVIELMDLHLSGTRPEQDWAAAVKAAETASA